LTALWAKSCLRVELRSAFAAESHAPPPSWKIVWGETGEAYQNAGLLRKDVLREVNWTELAAG